MVKYPARFKKDKAGETDCFYIEFIDMPEIFTQGETLDELIEMAEDALATVISVYIERNKEIPKPSRVTGADILHIELKPEIALPLLIKESRKSRGESQGKIAQKLKVPYQTYQRWEQADKFNPTLKTLQKVADALGKKLVIDLIEK